MQDRAGETGGPGSAGAATADRAAMASRRLRRAWALAMGWALVVWMLGSDAFSARATAAFLRPIVDWFVSDFSTRDMYLLLLTLRKGAHMMVYGLLALLVVRALWIGSMRSLITSLGLTVISVALLAMADETRQGYSAVRNGSAWDVALDLVGATVVLLVLVTLQNLRKRPLFAPAVAELFEERGAP